jgi:hypothetical protein
MKKLTLALSFMLTVSLCTLIHSNAYSQPPAGGQGQRQQMTVDQRLDQLDKAVGGLTADQKKKIRAVWEEAQKTRGQRPQAQTPPPPQTPTAPPADNGRPNTRRDRLDQQQQQTQQTQQQQGGRGGFGRGGFGGLNPEIEKILTPAQQKKWQTFQAQNMIDRRIEGLSGLNLTEDQKTKLRTVFENQNARQMKMREQMQGQDQNQDRQAMMDTFRKMQEQNNNEIKKVLTPAQAKQYDDMMQQQMNRRGQGDRGGRGQQN